LLKNAEQLTGSLETSSDITLFLKSNVNDSAGRQLAETIKEWSDVNTVDLITQSAALAEFKDYSGFGDALNALENNPLPTVLQVIPKNSMVNRESLEALLDKLKRLDEVDIAQMDMQWIQRLQSMMDLARQGLFLLSGVLSFAVLFVMGNTIRLELEDRRDEVLISKLVGATHAFIQRRFLYIGFLFGLFSGMIAWVIVMVVMLILKAPMERLSELYDHNYEVLFLNISESLILLAISSSLGVLGAWMVLHYQLKSIRLE
jgi:cell division transport system permease protein